MFESENLQCSQMSGLKSYDASDSDGHEDDKDHKDDKDEDDNETE